MQIVSSLRIHGVKVSLSLKNQRQLIKSLTEIFESAGLDKTHFEPLTETIILNLTYPLLLALSSKQENVKLPESIPINDKNDIVKDALINLRLILLASGFEETIISMLEKEIRERYNPSTPEIFVPLYPSNQFTLELVLTT